MKKVLCALTCAMMVVAGCTASEFEEPVISRNQNAFNDAFNTQGDVLQLSIDDLVEINFKLEHAYQLVAERADSANHFSNVFLLSSALTIALGEIGSASSKAIERQIALTLGINEGFKYANPPQVARAYRKAAREALCMAHTTIAYGHGANARKGQVNLVVAMRHSHTNLRERLTREPVGFQNLLTNKSQQKDILQREDRIATENKLALERAKTAQNGTEDGYAVRLLSCLT